VFIKGSEMGTTTDEEGKFSLSIGSTQKLIEVSFIGYNPQVVSLADKSNLNIALKETVSSLSEVVVTRHNTKSNTQATESSPVQENGYKARESNLILTDSLSKLAQTQRLDSIKLLLKKEPGSKELIRQLAEIYLERKSKNESVEKLTELKNLSSDSTQLRILDDIIRLTESGKYGKALTKVQGLKE
jgi:hypothetical protein